MFLIYEGIAESIREGKVGEEILQRHILSCWFQLVIMSLIDYQGACVDVAVGDSLAFLNRPYYHSNDGRLAYIFEAVHLMYVLQHKFS